MLRFAGISGPLGLFRNRYSIWAVANPEMMVDISALFAYKGAATILGIKNLERGSGVPTDVSPLCCAARSAGNLASSGSSFVNVVVDAGSSSVRVQKVTSDVMSRAGNSITSNSTAALLCWPGCTNLTFQIAGGTR